MKKSIKDEIKDFLEIEETQNDFELLREYLIDLQDRINNVDIYEMYDKREFLELEGNKDDWNEVLESRKWKRNAQRLLLKGIKELRKRYRCYFPAKVATAIKKLTDDEFLEYISKL